jgi:hypothetical protein
MGVEEMRRRADEETGRYERILRARGSSGVR